MPFKEISKKLDQKWSQLGQEEKQKYAKIAILDRERYSREFLEYQQTDNYKEFISQKEAAKNEIKGIKKGLKRYPKSPGAPKQPLSSYTYFKIDRREGVREDSPDMSNKEIYEKLASEWSQLGQEEKQKYVERAKLDKKRYRHEFLEYQKTDNYKEFISQKEASKNGIKGKIRG